MSIHKNRTVSMNLDEDLNSLGINATTKTLQVLSEGSDGGTFFSGSLFQHKGQQPAAAPEGAIDPLDSEFVTVELMDRLEALDLDQISEDDLAEVLEGLGEKELPEDEELIERIKNFVGKLEEMSFTTAGAGGVGKVRKKRRSASVRRKERLRRRRGPVKAAAERARKKRERAPSALAKRGARAAERKRKKEARKSRRRNRREGTELALELRGMSLSESKNFGEYTETIERIGRVMDLISEWIDQPSVDEVLSEHYENLTDSLMESTEDFQEKVTPCLNVIKRCLEEIEEGN